MAKLEKGPGLRALVVEPDAAYRDELVTALAARGIQGMPVDTGRDALASLDHFTASALIVSAQLPEEMSGFDLARTIRKQAGAGQVVVLLTDVPWGQSQRSIAIQQMGIHDLLTKPVSATEVADAVTQALASVLVAELSGHGTDPGTGPIEPSSSTPVSQSGLLADPATHQERLEVERATEAVRAGPVEMRGNLAATPFPMLLHTLYRKTATGGLFLLRDQVKKVVYFKDGHPSYVKSNLLSECLGKILVRERLISEAQCKESLRRMKKTRRQQGTVLVEMGVISPHNLVVGLELQLRTKLMEIFTWTRGEYLFKSDARVPSDVISLDVSTATLIADAIRSCWDLPRMEETLEPYWDLYLTTNPDPGLRFQELSLLEDEQAFLDSVDGVRTLRQLVSDSPLPRQKAMAVACALITTQVCLGVEEPSPLDPVTRPVSKVWYEEPLREQLAQRLTILQQRDPYGVLEIPFDATPKQVEEAYASLAQEYHPDHFHNASLTTRLLAEELFDLILSSYRLISSGGASGEQKPAAKEPSRPVSHVTDVAMLVEEDKRRAMAMMAEERWAEAAELLGHAVELCPDGADLWTLHGWAIYQSVPGDESTAQRATRALRRAVELNPRDHQAYLYLGRIYAAMDKAILAEKQFEKALQCKPDCNEALEELRIQRARRPARRSIWPD